MISKEKLQKNVGKVKDDTKSALQTMYDALNQGQRKKIIKNAEVKALFDRYGVRKVAVPGVIVLQIDIIELYKLGGAVVGIVLFIIGLYKLYDKIVDNQKAQEKRIDRLEKSHAEDIERLEKEIKHIKKENSIIIRGLQGCLGGLIQLNCNGEVTDTKKEIDDYLNNAAHDQ